MKGSNSYVLPSFILWLETAVRCEEDAVVGFVTRGDTLHTCLTVSHAFLFVGQRSARFFESLYRDVSRCHNAALSSLAS